jgi:hypothetical protein
MTAMDVLREVAAAGGHVAVDGGDLVVEAPQPLPAKLVGRLRAHKGALLAHLRGKRSSEPSSAPAGSLSREIQDAIDEALEERAGIHQFEGGLPRAEAERSARESMRVYEYRLADTPSTWLVLIAPGCDLPEARRVCERQFGHERVLDVRPSWERLNANGRPE